MVAELDAFKPVVLEANPSFLATLSRHIVRRAARAFSRGHYPHVRESLDPASSSDPPRIRRARRELVRLDRDRLRIHGVRGRSAAPGDRKLSRRFPPIRAGARRSGRRTHPRHAVRQPWRSLVRFDVGDVVRLSAAAPCLCGRDEGSTRGRSKGARSVSPDAGRQRGDTGRRRSRARRGGGTRRVPDPPDGSRGLSAALCGGRGCVDRRGSAREALLELYGGSRLSPPRRLEAIHPDPPGKYRLAKMYEPVDHDTLLDERYAPMGR